MADSVLRRVPVVAGLAYIERVRSLPSTFSATLEAEPENRYNPHAIAVLAGGEKVGYVAPEIARRYPDSLNGQTCPARRATVSDHETSGVEFLLDLSGLTLPATE